MALLETRCPTTLWSIQSMVGDGGTSSGNGSSFRQSSAVDANDDDGLIGKVIEENNFPQVCATDGVRLTHCVFLAGFVGLCDERIH
jgi:hypothetical protein